MTKQRTMIFVSFIGFGWHVREQGRKTLKTIVGWNKEDAVAWARGYCQSRHEAGDLLELKIRDRLGRIKESDTYGEDPRPPKGAEG